MRVEERVQVLKICYVRDEFPRIYEERMGAPLRLKGLRDHDLKIEKTFGHKHLDARS